MKLAWIAIAAGCGLCAQVAPGQIALRATDAARDSGSSQAMQSPVVGFVASPGGTEVHAILGVPGASLLSGALSIPSGVTRLYLSPGQQYAIAQLGSASERQYATPRADRKTVIAKRSLAVLPFSGAQAGTLAQITGMTEADIVSFSPNGGTAVVYSTQEGLLQVITGLPSAPQIAVEVKRSALPDDVLSLAIADDGVTLFEGTAHNAVYLIASGAQPALIYTAADLGPIRFEPGSTDAAVFDRGNGNLMLLHNAEGSFVSRPLVQGLAGLSGDPLLQFDSTTILAAGTASTTLWEIDGTTGSSQQVQLSSAPGMLLPLQSPHHFALSWQAGKAAWILDTSGAAGTVYFVPPGTVQAR